MADNCLPTDVNGGKVVPKRRVKKHPVMFHEGCVKPNGFGDLGLVQEHPWRVKHLVIGELAMLMHWAEHEGDDLTVVAITDEIARRNANGSDDLYHEFFRREYQNVAAKLVAAAAFFRMES